MTANLYRSPVPEQLWDRIREEFTLPTLEQVRERLAAVHEDPEPSMRQLVRVFVDDQTYCPGFQFRTDLSLSPVVVRVFERAMQLRIPHNYFALWMMVRSPALQGRRPVDLKDGVDPAPLLAALDRVRADVAA
ncbi:hypothetical protein [Arthrobacter sp. fls2-241-R2A-172]|uniref:hypothetical protein n=1 Tax=Arthrobacter sp. fls2-241-R2A-172 TaxID=3040325 RepID=UPI00254A855A|nr:hypothetical protein [Arthrobacter sp. fls2-241-R2A-172]